MVHTGLNTQFIERAVVGGLDDAGCKGSNNTDPERSFTRIASSPLLDFRQLTLSDFNMAQGLSLNILIGGGCEGQLTDGKQAEIWDRILDIAGGYWADIPGIMPITFPRTKFTQPEITCDTQVIDLMQALSSEWEAAQQ